MSDAWRLDAKCREAGDPSVFYPDRTDLASITEARWWCARCPVTVECLAEGHRLGDEHTIRGGLTPDERPKPASQREPYVWTEEKVAELRWRTAAGETANQIAAVLGVSQRSVRSARSRFIHSREAS